MRLQQGSGIRVIATAGERTQHPLSVPPHWIFFLPSVGKDQQELPVRRHFCHQVWSLMPFRSQVCREGSSQPRLSSQTERALKLPLGVDARAKTPLPERGAVPHLVCCPLSQCDDTIAVQFQAEELNLVSIPAHAIDLLSDQNPVISLLCASAYLRLEN